MLQSCVRRGETCNWYAEWRAGNIVVADEMAPLDGIRVATVLTTDAYFERGAGLAAFGNCPIHEFAYTTTVNGLEGVRFEDALFLIGDEEVAFCIVTGITVGHLGQVIGSEREELSMSGDFRGGHCGTRDFDHCAELIFELDFLFIHDCGGDALESGLDPFQFLYGSGQWDHDFRLHNDATQCAICGSFEDGTDLHFHDLRHR